MEKYLSDNMWFLTEDKTIVQVQRDDYSESPREAFDNLGKLFVGTNSILGKNETDFADWDELMDHYGVKQSGTDREALYRDIYSLTESAFDRGDIMLPISVYEHSGASVYVGTPQDHFDGRWDCSFAGFIIADDATIRKEYDTNDAYTADCVRQVLEDEVKTLNQWVNGETYGFVSYDLKGEEVDSCWGFYGDEIAESGIEDCTGKFVASLGEYANIEDCLTANAEKLGITIDPEIPFSKRVHVLDEAIEAIDKMQGKEPEKSQNIER